MKAANGKRRVKVLVVIVVALVAILLGGGYYFQWRSERAWKKFKAHWEGQGEHFELEHYIPAAIPDEENLAMHPLFHGLSIKDSAADKWFQQIDSAHAQGYVGKSTRARRDFTTPGDFSKWKELDERLTQEERIREILRRFAPNNGPLDQVASALEERRRCHFPIDWDNLVAAETPHIFKFLRVSDAFLVRSNLHLQIDDSDQAVRDLVATVRLGDAAGQDGYFVAFLVELAIHRACVEVLWDGLAAHKFDEEQLAMLDARYSSIGPLAEQCLTAIRVERSALLHYLDDIRYRPEKLRPGPSGKQSANKPWVRFWTDANRLAICQDLQEHLLSSGGALVQRPTIKGVVATDAGIADRLKGSGKFINAIASAVPSITRVVGRTLDTEADLINARVAIALERYRLKHGAYPPDLSALVPEFLDEPLRDLTNDRPIEYRIKPDGTPLIYQWGQDGDDDGGRPRVSPEHGDVVWQYTLEPPLSEADWRRKD